MLSLAILLGLSAIAAANPLPQSIDPAVNSAAAPAAKSAPWGAGSELVSYNPKSIEDATYNNVLSGLRSGSSKRSLNVRTQAGPCGSLPSGYGPVPTPDTAAAFSNYSAFSDAANNAAVPNGYVNVFSNLNGASSLSGYLGYDTLQSYDVQGCANKCNTVTGCIAFNIYFERDPTILPADSCPNPASTTNIKCTYWGAPLGPETATNTGQFANSFQIVNAGSNGYNAQNVNNVPGYSGDFLDSASINAPQSCNSYIGYQLFNDGQPFDPSRCAAACKAETDYNTQYLNGQAICRFFNTYVLSKNGVPQGQYCSLYTASWDDSYATNTGYTSGSDVYTISYSYSYSNTTDPRLDDCTCGIGSTCNTGVSSTTSATVISTTSSTTVASSTSTSTSTTTVLSITTTTTTSMIPSTTTPSTTTTTSAAPSTTSNPTTPSTTTTTTVSVPSTTVVTTSSTTTTSSKPTSSSSSTTTSTTSSTTTTPKSTTTTATTTTTSTLSTTSKASTTSATTLSTTTKTTTTVSATPTPKGPCFRVKIKGPSYCNNQYVGLDSTGALSYTATNPATLWIDDNSTVRHKDGRYGKCPNAKTSDKNGAIQFAQSSDPMSVQCTGSGNSVSCKVAGQSVTSLWTNAGQGTVVLGNKPSSGRWDQISVQVEFCSCSA